MKEKNILKAVLNTSAIFLLIIGVMVFLYLKDPDKNYLYYQVENYKDVVVARYDILAGEVISEENVNTITVKDTELLFNEGTFISDIAELLGKKVLYPINKGQAIPGSYLLSKGQWYEGKHEYAIEVDIPSTVANSINIGDFVDINISYDGLSYYDASGKRYYENFDTIISKIMIEDIKNTEGVSLKESIKQNAEGTFTPTYMKINITYEQMDSYLGAQYAGTIFLIKYDDVTAKPNVVTYREDRRNILRQQELDAIEEPVVDVTDELIEDSSLGGDDD